MKKESSMGGKSMKAGKGGFGKKEAGFGSKLKSNMGKHNSMSSPAECKK